MTAPAAFTTSLLAWGLLQFPDGYAQANATIPAMETVRWGADYLLKTISIDNNNATFIVYQVLNRASCCRLTQRRPTLCSNSPNASCSFCCRDLPQVSEASIITLCNRSPSMNANGSGGRPTQVPANLL